jgi:16S rRNA (adenine1518-N6/adenine1519-N6)-dimethyltransferase
LELPQNFIYDKRLGQNFLRDPGLLQAIVRDAGVTADDLVVEVGAGAGTLTARLCEAAGGVVSYEIDRRLQPVLAALQAQYPRLQVIFGDFLGKDVRLPTGAYKAVANLPYYITAPVLFAFAESVNPPVSMTVMVQYEVARRLTADADTPAYGAMTATLGLQYTATLTRKVDRRLFFPVPNVDSAVVRLDKHTLYDGYVGKAARVIRAAFCQRRKTLANALTAGLSIDKAAVTAAAEACGISPSVRGETLTPAQFVALAKQLV